jgi:intergrase/recombinase
MLNPLIPNVMKYNGLNEIVNQGTIDCSYENGSSHEQLVPSNMTVEKDSNSKKLDLNVDKIKPCKLLNDVWLECKSKFQEWLKHKNISEPTKREYLSALLRFFENWTISRPIEFRDLTLKDKEERGLRNLFNYFEDEEQDEICGHSLEKWRRFVKIKKSGVVEIYVNDQEIKEAYKACTAEMKPIFKLLVYSGNRFSHIHEMLKGFDERNLIKDGEVSHYPTSFLSSGTKSTFHLYFPTSFIPELKKISRLKSYDYILKDIQCGRVTAKTIRKWHLNTMIKEGITESVADFIQGRASTTVGSAHYLNKVQQATDQYYRIVGKFPI